jgi:hypothetical protein
LNQEQRITSGVGAMTPRTCAINSRKVPANWCARHFVVSLAEDMKGAIQGVLGELIRQSLAEVRQQGVVGHSGGLRKG